ncbi:MAG: PAS domain-containing protein [Acidobacteria bacterium]|nr:PAS domain-containing protein [Acidobacteriota bacterium]
MPSDHRPEIDQLRTLVESLRERVEELERDERQREVDREVEREQLRESREMLRLVMDHIPQGIYWKDRSSVYRGCNRFFADMAGLDDPDEVLGKTDEDLPWSRWAERYRQLDREVTLSDGPEVGHEGPYIRADGSEGWLRTTKVPLHDSQGRVVAILGVDEDFTERRRHEEALRSLVEVTFSTDGEDFFRALVRRLAEALQVRYAFLGEVRRNDAGRVHTVALWSDGGFVDNITYALDGSPCSQVVGKTACAFTEGVRDRFPKDVMLNELGVESYLGAPLMDSANRPIGLLVAMGTEPLAGTEMAISILNVFSARAAAELERKRIDAALREARDQLERRVRERTADLAAAHQDLKSLLYIVSHDLRAPLINVKGFAGELRSGCQEVLKLIEGGEKALEDAARRRLMGLLGSDIPEALSFIDTSIDRINHFMNTLLRLSQQGQRSLSMELVDTTSLVKELFASLAYQLEQRSARVHVAELPPVVGDRISLEQIFGNLLSNAVLYLDPDRPGEIEVRGETSRDLVTYHVRDNGCGIPKEDLPKVFAPFRRGRRLEVEGEGMGLAYVQALVRRHGGRIWCESEPGVGSTFSFALSAHLQPDDLRSTTEIWTS